MVPPAMSTQMLGAEVSRWLMGACLLKQMPEAPVLATPVWLTGRWDGLEMGELQDADTAKARL